MTDHPAANNFLALDGGFVVASQHVQHNKYWGELNWTIEDFFVWSELQANNFVYHSSPFELRFDNSTLTFQLKLQSNNKTDDNLGFHVVNLNSEDLTLDFKLKVIDSSGAVFHCTKGCSKFAKYTSAKVKALSKKDLRDHLPGGTLKLKCEMIIYKVAVSSSTKVENYDPEDYTPGLYEDIEKLWSEEFATDFNLRCAGELFPCHKFVLASRSNVFKRMFCHKDLTENVSNEANIEDFTPKSVKRFLEFLYTDALDKDKDGFNSVDLLLMADKYNVARLKINCEKALSTTVDTSNAIKLFCTASAIEAPYLTENTAKFILKNIDELFDKTEWKEMVKNNPEHMNNIFKFRRTI